ncbi:MAG: aspartate kinase [Verrucomicrobiota bacterium]
MSLIVQKYGGTSVANADRIKNVAKRVAACRAAGHQVVVVTSAMSGVTDDLIKMAKAIMPLPNEREMDMLLATGEQTTIALTAIALQSLGVPAISLTGAQAGIVTDGVHSKAKIKDITPKQIHALLKQGQVVIVAGFQGQTMEGQITTLGRGGSDLTAIALAAALKAGLCQIYTDVDGVYTADPRIVPKARKLSVEFAKKFGVVFEVRSSLNDNPGTIVKEETLSMESVVIRGVSLDKNQAKLTLVQVPDRPGVAALVFKAIADANINVDMIVQNISHNLNGPATDISFTVDKADLPKAHKTIEALRDKIGFRQVIADEEIGKLSIVGVGMRSHPGVAAKMFESLAQAGINIDMISTSEIKVSVTIDLAKGEEAMRLVHGAFLG